QRLIRLERVREDQARAALVEPLELPAPEQEDAAQHELAHAPGVLLGVGERERATPRAAEHLPALDPELLPERLDVRDEVPGRVVDERGVGTALAAAALVEQNDAVARGVEEAALPRARAAARSTVEEHDGLSIRVPGLFEIDRVLGRDVEVPRPVRLDLRIEGAPRNHGTPSV